MEGLPDENPSGFLLICFSHGINCKSWLLVTVWEIQYCESHLSNSFSLYHWNIIIPQVKCKEGLEVTFLVFGSEICSQNLLKYLKTLTERYVLYFYLTPPFNLACSLWRNILISEVSELANLSLFCFSLPSKMIPVQLQYI